MTDWLLWALDAALGLALLAMVLTAWRLLRGPTLTPALRQLLVFEAARARSYYTESAPLVGMVHPGSRPQVYHRRIYHPQ